MSPRTHAAFRIDDELLEGLHEVYERDGILVPEQVRRAIRMWLESKGVKPRAKPGARRSSKSKVRNRRAKA